MAEEMKKSIEVLPPEKEKKADYSNPIKIFIASLLGGLTAGVLFYIFEQLSEDKKARIKEQVSTAIKAHFKKWAEE
ncbi:MAG: hypothetical protein J7M18_02650 [Candidatus Eremiobacteraeota bacterium]|nr:hypothetical protein [Candidatus Eremiobacteraeota bacterium]